LMQAIGAPPPAEAETPRQIASTRANTGQTSSPPGNSGTTGRSPQIAQADKTGVAESQKDFVQRSEADAASQNIVSDHEDSPPSRPRGHGGALPK
ncbi:MAG: hypothetical protein ACREQD_15530, partial [Candidatus Binataceae bacterium]